MMYREYPSLMKTASNAIEKTLEKFGILPNHGTTKLPTVNHEDSLSNSLHEAVSTENNEYFDHIAVGYAIKLNITQILNKRKRKLITLPILFHFIFYIRLFTISTDVDIIVAIEPSII